MHRHARDLRVPLRKRNRVQQVRELALAIAIPLVADERVTEFGLRGLEGSKVDAAGRGLGVGLRGEVDDADVGGAAVGIDRKSVV